MNGKGAGIASFSKRHLGREKALINRVDRLV